MRKKTIALVLLLIVAVLVSTPFVYQENNKGAEEGPSPLIGFDLVKPPAIVTANPSDPDYGDPLTTSDISLFCYYKESSFTLVDTVAAWQTYTDHDNYYDGTIRIRPENNGTDFASAGTAWNVDILARVRADGYIMTWINRTVGAERFIPQLGGTSSEWDSNGGVPLLANSTCLYRAMEKIYNAAGLYNSMPTPNEVYYYDFRNSTSTRFCFFGHGGGDLSYYYTFPGTTTVDYMCGQYWHVGTHKNTVHIDSDLLASQSGVASIQYTAVGSAYRTTEAQHVVTLDMYGGEHLVFTVMVWSH